MKKIQQIILLLALGLYLAPIFAQAKQDTSLFYLDDFLMDDQHSYIGFKIKYFGFSPVRGRFNAFRGHILYDSSDLTKTSASLFIDVRSINTGVSMRDKDLVGEHWFDSDRFPHISFISTQATPTNTGFSLMGMLTIKGSKRPISITFEKPTRISRDFAGNHQVDFSGRLSIKRSDYGVIGEGFWNSLMDGTLQQLADEVAIEIDIHCRRPDYQIRYEDLDTANIRKVVVDQLMVANREKIQTQLSKFESSIERERRGLSSGALNTIGHILLMKEKLEAARQVFNKRKKWYPEATNTNVNLARVAARAGKSKETISYLREAITTDSTNTLGLELIRMLDNQ